MNCIRSTFRANIIRKWTALGVVSQGSVASQEIGTSIYGFGIRAFSGIEP
jgi:hypothetical protein